MRTLVTGATGFIGFHTARRLRECGHDVRVLVRDKEKALRVLGPLGINEDAIVVGDMTDADAVERALVGCDSVVHAAAGVSVTTGQTDFSANLRGTETVIGRACGRGLYTIFVSSVMAIFTSKAPMTGDSPLIRSKTHYGRSKTECDAWVRDRQATGAAVAIVYPPGVVGPDDPGFSESVKAYRAFLRGTLKSEGGNQLVDARDLAQLFVRMLEEKTPGRIIAGGHFFDWDQFTTMLETATGARISRITAPGWVLRFAARAMDVIGKLTGKPMPMTGEGIEIATRFAPMHDSRQVAELGVAWRPAVETVADLFRWYVDAERLPPKAVPILFPVD